MGRLEISLIQLRLADWSASKVSFLGPARNRLTSTIFEGVLPPMRDRVVISGYDLDNPLPPAVSIFLPQPSAIFEFSGELRSIVKTLSARLLGCHAMYRLDRCSVNVRSMEWWDLRLILLPSCQPHKTSIQNSSTHWLVATHCNLFRVMGAAEMGVAGASKTGKPDKAGGFKYCLFAVPLRSQWVRHLHLLFPGFEALPNTLGFFAGFVCSCNLNDQCCVDRKKANEGGLAWRVGRMTQ